MSARQIEDILNSLWGRRMWYECEPNHDHGEVLAVGTELWSDGGEGFLTIIRHPVSPYWEAQVNDEMVSEGDDLTALSQQLREYVVSEFGFAALGL